MLESLKKILKKIGWFFKEICTDSNSRPEIKMILGIPFLIAGLIVGLLALINNVKDFNWTGWSIFMGFVGALIITTAAADSKIDSAKNQNLQ